MGSNSAWLPSRRSVESQRGARVMLRLGHWRSGNATGPWRYLVAGLAIIMAGSTSVVPGCGARGCVVAAARHGSSETNRMTSPAALRMAQELVWGRGQGMSGGSTAARGGSQVCERVQTPAKH